MSTPTSPTPDFGPLRAAMQGYIDRELLAGLSWAVLRGREVVETHCVGQADREAGVPLRPDHIFRGFSNTKLFTSLSVLLLMEDGRLGLDDPIETHLPALGQRRVLKPGAQTLDDTEPARSSITVRHLLTHSAGLSYGLFEPGSLLDGAYAQAAVNDPRRTLAEMIDSLAGLPLGYHPGTSWAYSVATDVLARLVEVASGERFDRFLQQRLIGPLGLTDTGFVVPGDQAGRFVGYYRGADALNPFKPGLTRIDDSPWPGAFRMPVPRLSGGGGLVTTLTDMVRLVSHLVPGTRGEPTVLRPETLALLSQNQLAPGNWLRFAASGPLPGLGHGLVGAVRVSPGQGDTEAMTGEFRWGGVAGTQWIVSPRQGIAAVLMAQREMAFWHPVAVDFKLQVYRAFGLL